MKTSNVIFEPFKIKMVEPIPVLSPDQRKSAIKNAHYNLFTLNAEDVTFDLLTDSGTSAMSAQQWSGIMIGDESYAGSRSFIKFEKTVQDLTGYEFVIPTHQGRSAEALLTKALLKPGQVVIGNTHFDTTRANIEARGAIALDMPSPETNDTSSDAPFKGNIDTDYLKSYLKERHTTVAFLIMTVTNNSVGGQPVSMKNIEETRQILNEYNIPLFLDVARFSENSFFVKQREAGYENWSIKKIAQKTFSLADGALMSSKKDAFANIGGFLALNDPKLAQLVRNLMVITEGFPTYGGLAGRDLEALAIGLEEILDDHYLTYRIRSTEYFGKGLESVGIKTVRPYGGHAVYIDAGASLPHIPASQYPGQSMSVALYENVGIRSVEVGSVMLGYKDSETGEEVSAPKELVRLAIPRRVYTQSHVDYMIEQVSQMVPKLNQLTGYAFTYEAPALRHFTARFEKIKP